MEAEATEAAAEEPTAEELPADGRTRPDLGRRPPRRRRPSAEPSPPSRGVTTSRQIRARTLSPAAVAAIVGAVKRTGQKLLRFDRKLGARFVAGADEAGRGSLAGPLVVAGVLLDYGSLREHRVRPLALPERLEAVLARAARGALPRRRRLRRAGRRARHPAGRHRPERAPQVEPRRAARDARRAPPPAEACLVDGFRLGPAAPEHTAVVDGDDEERGDRGGVDRREGDARPADAPPRRALSRVRLRAARRLHHARPLRRRSRARPVAPCTA